MERVRTHSLWTRSSFALALATLGLSAYACVIVYGIRERSLTQQERIARIEGELHRLAAVDANATRPVPRERKHEHDTDGDAIVDLSEAGLAPKSDGKLRSLVSQERSSLRLVNCYGAPIDIFWINHNGEEIPRGVVQPGAVWRQRTWDTHPFVIRDETSGSEVTVIVANAESWHLVLDADGDVHAEPLSWLR